MAAVDKIEARRKPEDFIGHRNREAAPKHYPNKSGLFVLFHCARFERSYATRTSAAAEGWTEANIYFAPAEQNADKSS